MYPLTLLQWLVGLALSLKAEKILENLLSERAAAGSGAANVRAGTPGENGERSSQSGPSSNHGSTSGHPQQPHPSSNQSSLSTRPQSPQKQHGLQYQNHDGTDSVIWGPPNTPQPASGLLSDGDLEEKALALAIEETWAESGKKQKWRPWGANGRATRIGEIVLLVDSDTVVPEDCLRDAAREFAASPRVGIIQHESGMWIVIWEIRQSVDLVL